VEYFPRENMTPNRRRSYWFTNLKEENTDLYWDDENPEEKKIVNKCKCCKKG
jgi:hypothetical protein